MTATTASRSGGSSRLLRGAARITGKGMRGLHKGYSWARGKAGDAWAIVPPAALAGVEYGVHEKAPIVENSGATDDMLIASGGALALSSVLTLAANGAGLDINRQGVKRGIEVVSTGVATATDLAARIQIAGTEIGHNPVVTWASGIVALGSAALGSVAGYSSGRALSQ